MWWITEKNRHKVNLSYNLVQYFQEKGCKFCYFKDNKELWEKILMIDKSNKDIDLTDVLVTTSIGENIKGKIIHMVNGKTYGTNEKNWFIIRP